MSRLRRVGGRPAVVPSATVLIETDRRAGKLSFAVRYGAARTRGCLVAVRAVSARYRPACCCWHRRQPVSLPTGLGVLLGYRLKRRSWIKASAAVGQRLHAAVCWRTRCLRQWCLNAAGNPLSRRIRPSGSAATAARAAGSGRMRELLPARTFSRSCARCRAIWPHRTQVLLRKCQHVMLDKHQVGDVFRAVACPLLTLRRACRRLLHPLNHVIRYSRPRPAGDQRSRRGTAARAPLQVAWRPSGKSLRADFQRWMCCARIARRCASSACGA